MSLEKDRKRYKNKLFCVDFLLFFNIIFFYLYTLFQAFFKIGIS